EPVESPPARTRPPAAPPVSDLAGLRLLVAEDDETNRQILATRLRRAGVEVAEAAEGQAAIDAALEAGTAGRPFDLALVDLDMPRLDGREVARQLQALGGGPPLIALTAHATAQVRAECL